MDHCWLDPWFCSFKDVNHKELIVPRKTWFKCDGQAISLWNQTNWDKIVKEWGSFVSIEPQNLDDDALTNPLICIATHLVRKIKETFKVLIGDENIWVIMEEVAGGVTFSSANNTCYHCKGNSSSSDKVQQSENEEACSPRTRLSSPIIQDKTTDANISERSKINNHIIEHQGNQNVRDSDRSESSIDLDINEANSYTSKENEILSKEQEWEMYINKLNLGRNRGRPRKNPKKPHLFEFKRKIKKNAFKSKEGLPKLEHNSQWTSKAMVPSNMEESQARSSNYSPKDILVNRIIEVGECLGLIDPPDRYHDFEIISSSIHN